MVLRSVVSKYKAYEAKELTRRAEKRKKISPYKSLAKGKIKVVKPKGKFTKENLTRAIGNPYSVKYPKAKKTLKKIKKRHKRKRRKVVVVTTYR